MKKLARNISILLIALLLACCLVAGFAACGGDEPTEGGTPEGNEGNEGESGGAGSYKFEAEYVNIASSVSGGSIFTGPYDTDLGVAVLAAEDCSNGYCVGNMNRKGCYITFEIESDAAVEAEIFMSISMNYEVYNPTTGGGNKVTLTNEDFEVLVNTTSDSEHQQYTSIDFDMTGLSDYYTHRAFKEVSVGKVTLKEGTNTITLKTNNSYSGGTPSIAAASPLVDYIRLDTSATLSWTPDTSIVDGTSMYPTGKTTLVS